MRGGFLLENDPVLFARSAAVLTELGAIQRDDDIGGSVMQLADSSGRLFTPYECVPEGAEWEVRTGPFMLVPLVQAPDMNHVVACPFECRWPDLLADVA